MEANVLILFYENKNQTVQWIVTLIILLGKFHIHKVKFLKSHMNLSELNSGNTLTLSKSETCSYTVVDMLQEF